MAGWAKAGRAPSAHPLRILVWSVIRPAVEVSGPRRYCIWWGLTIAAAGFTGFYEPWVVAFLPHAER